MVSNEVRVSRDIYDQTAMAVSQSANRFKSDIYITTGFGRIDAKNVMSIIYFGIKKGDAVSISASGPDENNAICEISSILQNY